MLTRFFLPLGVATIGGFSSAWLFYLIAHKKQLHLDPLFIGIFGITLASLGFLVLQFFPVWFNTLVLIGSLGVAVSFGATHFIFPGFFAHTGSTFLFWACVFTVASLLSIVLGLRQTMKHPDDPT